MDSIKSFLKDQTNMMLTLGAVVLLMILGGNILHSINNRENVMEKIGKDIGVPNLSELSQSEVTVVLIERAYFEGQVDHAKGVVRVVKDSEGDYVWSQSPWDSGRVPAYNPKKGLSSKQE